MLTNLRSKLGKNSFARDVIYTAVGQVTVMLLMLMFNKIISIMLTTDEYGIFSIANKASSFFAFIMVFCLGIALPVYLAKYRTQKNVIKEAHFMVTTLIIMFIAIDATMVFGLIFGEQLSHIIFGDYGSYNYMILPIFILSVSTALSTYVYSYFRGIDRFGTFNLIQIVLQLIAVIIAYICGANIAMQFSSRAVIIGMLSAVIIVLIMVNYRKVKIDSKNLKSQIKEVFDYCAPRVPGEMILFGFMVIPLIIINHKFGINVTAAVAVGVTMLTFATPLFQFVGMALLPHSSRCLAQGRINELAVTINKLRAVYMVTSLVIVIIIFVLTDLLLTLLFSYEYQKFAPAVRLIVLGCIPYALYLLLRNPLDAVSKKPFNTINLLCSFVVLLLITFFAQNEWWVYVAFPIAYLILGTLSEISWQRYLKTMED